jgi:hypothetical protein
MRSAVVLLLALAAGCGGEPDVPTVTVRAANADSVDLAWTHPPGPVPGGYQIESSIGGGAAQVIATVGPQDLSLHYLFTGNDPEQTLFAFRVRALPDGGASRASDAATIRRGVATPFLYCVTDAWYECRPVAGAHFDWYWEPGAVSRDRFQIERRTMAAWNAPASDWAVLLPPSAVTTYSDPDLSGWVHSSYYEYRLTAIGPDGEPGPAMVNWTQPAPP